MNQIKRGGMATYEALIKMCDMIIFPVFICKARARRWFPQSLCDKISTSQGYIKVILTRPSVRKWRESLRETEGNVFRKTRFWLWLWDGLPWLVSNNIRKDSWNHCKVYSDNITPCRGLNGEWDTLYAYFSDKGGQLRSSVGLAQLKLGLLHNIWLSKKNRKFLFLYKMSMTQIVGVPPKFMSSPAIPRLHWGLVRVMWWFYPVVCEQQWMRCQLLVPLPTPFSLSPLPLSPSLPSPPPSHPFFVSPCLFLSLSPICLPLQECGLEVPQASLPSVPSRVSRVPLH